MSGPARPVAVTAAGAVVSGPCTLRGLWLVTAAAGDTVTLYDGVAASGTVLARWTTTGATEQHVVIPDGLWCASGIYVDATGTLAGSVWIG